MRTIIALLLGTTAIGGCVIYDEKLVYEDTATEAIGDNGPERPGEGTDDTDAPAPSAALMLFPSAAVAGDLAILSLCADGVNLEEIFEISFLGASEIDILTTGGRGEGEFLMTVDIPLDSDRSSNHLLVELTNGTTLFLEDAFAVVSTTDDLPEGINEDGSCD
jgi:hypothetical protein